MKPEIKSLIDKAAKAHTPEDAMKFSQAALNAANAERVVLETEILRNDTGVR